MLAIVAALWIWSFNAKTECDPRHDLNKIKPTRNCRVGLFNWAKIGQFII